jgi:hypothetical protein
MFETICVICICFMTLTAFSQSTSKYEVATIVDVKVHQAAGDFSSEVSSYEVSLKVGNTLYVVLYTPPLQESTVKYAVGRNLLVLVGKTKITHNDMLGRPLDSPILSQKQIEDAKKAK